MSLRTVWIVDAGWQVPRFVEVEFVAAEGRTLALLTLSGSDVRPMGTEEILHVRKLASA